MPSPPSTAPAGTYPLLGGDLVVLLPMSLGLVTALIIVADGWVKAGGAGIDKSAKLKSLLYVFGGSGFLGILTALDGIKDSQTKIILCYLFFTTIFLAVMLVAFATLHVPYFVSSFRRDHRELKFGAALAYSLPLSLNLIFEGFEAVTRRLSDVKLAMLAQPGLDLNIYNSFLDDMYILAGQKDARPAQRVAEFIAATGRMLVTSFGSMSDQQWRASLYCLPPRGDQYVQVCGLNAPGHGPLSATESLCATAAQYSSLVVAVRLKDGLPVEYMPAFLGETFVKFQATPFARTVGAIAAKSIYAENAADRSQFVLAVDVLYGTLDDSVETRLTNSACLIRWGLLMAELDPELIGLAAQTLAESATPPQKTEAPASLAVIAGQAVGGSHAPTSQ